MLKIRLQGTTRDLKWFRKVLEHQEEVRVLQASHTYANKGTNKYFRMYAEVERTGGQK